jgi:hypothetical protein
VRNRAAPSAIFSPKKEGDLDQESVAVDGWGREAGIDVPIGKTITSGLAN